MFPLLLWPAKVKDKDEKDEGKHGAAGTGGLAVA